MENIRMMCEMTAEGVQKCDEQHKITVNFTVSETDQCPYQAKCDCKMLKDAEPIRCSACAKVDGDLEVTELKVKCSDDGKEEEEEEEEEEEAEGVQKCDEQHKITVDFTVSETDQCPYQAKCDCK